FSKFVLRETPNFWVIHLFSVLDYQTDIFLLSILLTETHVGWYGAAQTILLVFWMIPTAVRVALYPLMTRYYHTDRAALNTLYEETSRLLLIAILPMAAGVALLAEPIILLIFDESFLPAVPALQWSIWAAVFAVLNVPSARLLIIAHQQRAATWITGLSMGANVLANLWLIPQWGIVGAAVSRTLASFVFALVIYLFAQRYILRHSLRAVLPRPVFATAVMTAVVFFVREINWGLAIVVGTAVYLSTIILIGGLTTRDKTYLRQLIGY
ncbi:MAG: polysaccharide biosynthesis C-terminal domain-containing protein, partial [Anaerolineales bacterium]|nr:polysaccharide biosynthesis C-terminal domain-containing protein [Anaerolineales bacterium]